MVRVEGEGGSFLQSQKYIYRYTSLLEQIVRGQEETERERIVQVKKHLEVLSLGKLALFPVVEKLIPARIATSLQPQDVEDIW